MNKDRLLSDGELRKKVDDYLTNSVILPKSNKDNITARLDGLLDLINTQKRLYAESAVGKKQPTCKYIVDFEHIATNWPPRQAESKDKVDDQL